ncbi:MAG: Lrp/AsnC ligand binding domain-containing protein [Anaerolineae bacterium]
MRGYVLVNARAGEERDIVNQIRQVPGIVRADVTFGPYDVIVEVQAADLATLGKLVYGTIRATPGVLDTLTCLAVE